MFPLRFFSSANASRVGSKNTTVSVCSRLIISCFNKRIEHQSDTARLQILLEMGGIYMDDDLVLLKSLDPLRSHQMVLGEENYDALGKNKCNIKPLLSSCGVVHPI